MTSATFAYNEERSTVVDYPYLLTENKLISILSSPIKLNNNNLFNIFNGFFTQIWLMLSISYLLFCAINFIGIKCLFSKVYICFDYFSLLLGKGMNL